MANRTYIMGAEAAMFFDRDLLENLRGSMSIWWKMSWRYYSNWRVLHIDGLEGCDADGLKRFGIPFSHTPMKYRFFQYATKSEEKT